MSRTKLYYALVESESHFRAAYAFLPTHWEFKPKRLIIKIFLKIWKEICIIISTHYLIIYLNIKSNLIKVVEKFIKLSHLIFYKFLQFDVWIIKRQFVSLFLFINCNIRLLKTFECNTAWNYIVEIWKNGYK